MAYMRVGVIAVTLIYIGAVECTKEIAVMNVDMKDVDGDPRGMRDLLQFQDFFVKLYTVTWKQAVGNNQRYPSIVEILSGFKDKTYDRVLISQDSYNYYGYYASNFKESQVGRYKCVNLAGLIQIPYSMPISATFRVDRKYRDAPCVKRTYTDKYGVLLVPYEEVTLDECPEGIRG